ncbi:polysaccharide deacetylase family protein [Proteinivorax tanatarense]|uniref:Polysaccharide deacetylase family protein n=1 Tax=Proteinivorax tanatarense TaxID=1260629 RepID=A0AAU7VNB8_9FIRM
MEQGGTKSIKVFVFAGLLLVAVLLAIEPSKNTDIFVAQRGDSSTMRFITEDMSFADSSVLDKSLQPQPQKANKEISSDRGNKGKQQDVTKKQKQTEANSEKQDDDSKINSKKIPVNHIDTTEKKVALTFDDGPNPQTLPQKLEILEKYDVSATFFVLGTNAKNNKHFLQKIQNNGHQVANHSYDHQRFSEFSYSETIDDMLKTERIIDNYSAGRYFRPPYGVYTDTTLRAAYDHGFEVVLWSVDPRDWEAQCSNRVKENVVNNTKPGGIILLHEGHQVTLEALPWIIEKLLSEGYQFVTIDELFKQH